MFVLVARLPLLNDSQSVLNVLVLGCPHILSLVTAKILRTPAWPLLLGA